MEKNTPANFPRLVADIGGTNARFAIETSPYKYAQTQIVACKDYATLAEAALKYLAYTKMLGKINNAALALPSPMISDTLFMVNSPWDGQSMLETKHSMKMDNVIFLNDFNAQALAIPHIDEKNLIKIGGKERNLHKTMAIIGPGTGLGMSTLINHPLEGYFSLSAEGGRSSFPPVNQEEIELWEFIHKRFNHVSAERFLSGPGIQLIYEALCEFKRVNITFLPTPAEIAAMGLEGNLVCNRTLYIFCSMLGTIASNLAVMVNATGGVYISGGIVPQILDFFLHSEFRYRFENKGRYRPVLAKIPVYVIIDKFPAFLGASYALDVYLKKGYVPYI